MSLQSRIQDLYPEFTQSEKQISEYFLHHLQEVSISSAKELAAHCGTSAPTIVRFARTLGYSGFPALKMDILLTEKNDIDDLTEEIEQNITVTRLVSTLYSHSCATMEHVRSLIDEAVVEKAADAVEKAGQVYLCGIGGSGIVCQDLQQKLGRIGIRVHYSPDIHVLLSSLSGMKENDVLIAISYSGETKSIIETVKVARERKAVVIGITQLGKTHLQKYADLVFHVPMEEKTIRAGAISSRDSCLFICDTLYLSLVSRHLSDHKKTLQETKGWTARL